MLLSEHLLSQISFFHKPHPLICKPRPFLLNHTHFPWALPTFPKPQTLFPSFHLATPTFISPTHNYIISSSVLPQKAEEFPKETTPTILLFRVETQATVKQFFTFIEIGLLCWAWVGWLWSSLKSYYLCETKPSTWKTGFKPLINGGMIFF